MNSLKERTIADNQVEILDTIKGINEVEKVENIETYNSTNDKIIYKIVKRIFDVFVGLIGCIALLPMMLIIKIANLCTKDYNSIFYKQKRIGKDGKTFVMYKFRTMIPNADRELVKLMKESQEIKEEYKTNKKLDKDPRITKVGMVLRKMSLDEFPQFINVLFGNMSFIGNRPYLIREKKDMGKYYKYIVKTKPGVTGEWQTTGRSEIPFNERLEIEKNYSINCSLKTDIKILFRTVTCVIKKEGAK